MCFQETLDIKGMRAQILANLEFIAGNGGFKILTVYVGGGYGAIALDANSNTVCATDDQQGIHDSATEALQALLHHTSFMVSQKLREDEGRDSPPDMFGYITNPRGPPNGPRPAPAGALFDNSSNGKGLFGHNDNWNRNKNGISGAFNLNPDAPSPFVRQGLFAQYPGFNTTVTVNLNGSTISDTGSSGQGLFRSQSNASESTRHEYQHFGNQNGPGKRLFDGFTQTPNNRNSASDTNNVGQPEPATRRLFPSSTHEPNAQGLFRSSAQDPDQHTFGGSSAFKAAKADRAAVKISEALPGGIFAVTPTPNALFGMPTRRTSNGDLFASYAPPASHGPTDFGGNPLRANTTDDDEPSASDHTVPATGAPARIAGFGGRLPDNTIPFGSGGDFANRKTPEPRAFESSIGASGQLFGVTKSPPDSGSDSSVNRFPVEVKNTPSPPNTNDTILNKAKAVDRSIPSTTIDDTTNPVSSKSDIQASARAAKKNVASSKGGLMDSKYASPAKSAEHNSAGTEAVQGSSATNSEILGFGVAIKGAEQPGLKKPLKRSLFSSEPVSSNVKVPVTASAEGLPATKSMFGSGMPSTSASTAAPVSVGVSASASVPAPVSSFASAPCSLFASNAAPVERPVEEKSLEAEVPEHDHGIQASAAQKLPVQKKAVKKSGGLFDSQYAS